MTTTYDIEGPNLRPTQDQALEALDRILMAPMRSLDDIMLLRRYVLNSITQPTLTPDLDAYDVKPKKFDRPVPYPKGFNPAVDLPEIEYPEGAKPKRVTAKSVKCPTCKAKPGKPCFQMSKRGRNATPTTETTEHMHNARYDRAREANS